jgi:tetratricopeptide (TPR) repeat protein
MDTPTVPEATSEETRPIRRSRKRRQLSCLQITIVAGVGLLLVLGAYGLVVRSAIQSGQELGVERAAATRSAEIAKQIRLAATDVWNGSMELAVKRLSYVLTETPDFPAIQATYQAAIVTPSPTTTPTPTPTSTPSATPNPQDAFGEAETAFEQGDWEVAIARLRHLQVVDPGYRADDVRQMLYTAYVSYGTELLDSGRLEEGIFYLDDAAALWPLPTEVLESRDKAIRYLRALSYWGVDWERTIEELELLTYGTIEYRDVFERLIEAHITYGDLWAAQEEWCPAEEQYGEAVRLRYDAELEEKRLDAAQLCQLATPTPMPGMITDTVPIGPIAGLTVGKLAYTVYNPTNGLYDLMVVNAASPVPIRYYSHVGQPSWSWDGGRLVFKSWGEDGLLTMPAGGGPASYVLDLSAGYPSFSPDGSRIAFSTRAYAENPQIYLAPLDGSAAPQYFATGQYPVWGPNGFLAYSGCLPDGATCGILIDNPDDGPSPVPLTGSLLDVPMSWSRDGANIAYMSPYDGDWDVYNVNVAGGVTLLTTNPSVDALPAWAPDGSGLAFLSDRDGSWGIYLMRSDGSEQRKIIDLGDQHHNWTSERISWGP